MIGRTLDHYAVEEALGKGGMGEVYRARDTRLGRSVALKVLPATVTSDEESKRRFFQEARAASAVTHPAIAQVYDVDEAEGVAFIVMELVAGRTVRALLENRELDLLGSLAVVVQVGEGLISAPLTLSDRLLETWHNLREKAPAAQWAWVVGLGVALVLALYLLFVKASVPTLIALGLGALFAWRRFRNRRLRLMRKFASRARRLAEVRVVAYEGTRLTVVVDKAMAKTYLRINTLVEQLNASMFFGDPFTVTVRDNATAEETRSLFSGSGVLYVRQDVLETRV